jgi:two-component system response regulator MprA
MPDETAKPCGVLLVDDEMRSVRVLAKMLREDGYEVEVAHHGAAAIARLARSPAPDILLTDYRMAHAGGIAVAEYARSRRAEMPILMLTGYPELATRLAGALRPRPVIIAKPIVYADMTSEIARERESAWRAREAGPAEHRSIERASGAP